MAYATLAGIPKLKSLCLEVECFRHQKLHALLHTAWENIWL